MVRWNGIIVGTGLCLLIAVGVARIVSTYRVFNQTTDEPTTLAAGIEWLQLGTYEIDASHPPLGRIAGALGPYFSGLRLGKPGDAWSTGTTILFSNHRYVHNLSIERLGVLPFFVFGTVLVWYWARARYGDGPAVIATLLFSTSPIVLGHGGLATTDIVITATFTWALLAFINLLERPTYFRAVLFGVASGFAILSKFSALLFLPGSGLAVLAWRWFLERGTKDEFARDGRFRWSKAFPLATLALFLVIWGGYRFTVGALVDQPGPHETVDRALGATGPLHNVAYAVVESHWVPAPAFVNGIRYQQQHNEEGHKSFLLGQVRLTGWWYFFPVALAVKNTVAALVLMVVGAFFLVKSSVTDRDWVVGAPVAAALGLLLTAMPSHINTGVRLLLPLFPLISIIGGVGAWRLWRISQTKYLGAIVVVLLLSWQLISSFRAHPDYFSYFNEFAGDHPENILIDSDLDWGQDLFRLSNVLREKRVQRVSLALAGSTDLEQVGLPPHQLLLPGQPTSGWIAISLYRLKLGGKFLPSDSFYWLEAYTPVCLVGRSIRLYFIPASSNDQTVGAH